MEKNQELLLTAIIIFLCPLLFIITENFLFLLKDKNFYNNKSQKLNRNIESCFNYLNKLEVHKEDKSNCQLKKYKEDATKISCKHLHVLIAIVTEATVQKIP